MNASIATNGAAPATSRAHRSDDLDVAVFARGTVWLANSSADVAVDVASRLTGLGLEVRVWPHAEGETLLGHDVALAGALWPGPPVADSTSVVEGSVARQVCRGGLAPGALRRVREAIDARLAEPITLVELARLAGLSTCHFARAFKQSMDVPPHRYIVERRIAAASQLVRQTTRPFIDVALSVGFTDHSHFTRMFVRITGETPRACRRRHR